MQRNTTWLRLPSPKKKKKSHHHHAILPPSQIKSPRLFFFWDCPVCPGWSAVGSCLIHLCLLDFTGIRPLIPQAVVDCVLIRSYKITLIFVWPINLPFSSVFFKLPVQELMLQMICPCRPQALYVWVVEISLIMVSIKITVLYSCHWYAVPSNWEFPILCCW